MVSLSSRRPGRPSRFACRGTRQTSPPTRTRYGVIRELSNEVMPAVCKAAYPCICRRQSHHNVRAMRVGCVCSSSEPMDRPSGSNVTSGPAPGQISCTFIPDCSTVGNPLPVLFVSAITAAEAQCAAPPVSSDQSPFRGEFGSRFGRYRWCCRGPRRPGSRSARLAGGPPGPGPSACSIPPD